VVPQTVLKVLLRGQHIQEHKSFCREYDKAARSIDISLVGSYPSKATFYRWLAGDLQGLPHPGPCRVLEKMLPGWTVAELFSKWNSSKPPEPRSARSAVNHAKHNPGFLDVTAIYTTRTQFAHELPPHVLLDSATSIRSAGLSLNMLCWQYPDHKLQSLLERGGAMDCLFLDPSGESTRAREREEGHADGTLANLTEVNIGVMERLRERLTPEAAERIRIRTYDETIRFNITLIDNETGIVQTYLPTSRGLENPTFITRRQDGIHGLYDVFAEVYESLWDKGRAR
jgi:Domain of unknown function (DUF5919)